MKTAVQNGSHVLLCTIDLVVKLTKLLLLVIPALVPTAHIQTLNSNTAFVLQ